MYTTAATFAAKIKSLQDFHSRLLNGVLPLPTGLDIVNTLSSLKQSLQVVLKDMPENILDMAKIIDEDAARLTLFPAMDYNGLYQALVLLIDDAGLIHTGLEEFAGSVFSTMIYLIPFLERDLLSSLPYIAASSLTQFPIELHKDIMNYLIFHILPFAVPSKMTENSYIALSIPSVLMTVLQYSEEVCQSSNVNAHHCHLLECLMALKPNLAKDILNIIAYGPSYTRVSASKLLFYYWPTFNSSLFERRAAPAEITEMLFYPCQNKTCGGNSNVTKMCSSIPVTLKYTIGSPSPLYLCIECANEIHREHPNTEFHDVLLPVHQASTSCDNKNCRGVEKGVVSICFSMECTSCNGNRPIRYCHLCHHSKHNDLRGIDHIYHMKLSQAWDMDPVMRSYLIDAAVSLLKEARPVTPEIPRDMTDIQAKAAAFNIINEGNSISPEERQLMGRFGALLLVGLCMPTSEVSQDVVGRILSILFNWFRITAYTYDNQEEYSLENLKKFTISKKLFEIHNMHLPTYVSCLLPHPAAYARVGGHWEMLMSHTSYLKNGLNKIYCLSQYNLITQEVWDMIMPHWLEAIVQDVSEKELAELKMAISKMLDINQCTLVNFDAKKMYHFIAIRFKRTSAKVQGQALSWLQILTLLDITLPIHMLFSFFEDGIDSLIETQQEYNECIPQLNLPRSVISPVVDFYEEIAAALSDDEGNKKSNKNINKDYCNENELKLQCCVLMLDIILKQMELHHVEYYIGTHSVMAQDISRILQKTITASWFMNHVCSTEADCSLCEACVVWHQLATMLIEYICPEDVAHPPDPAQDESSDDSKKSPPDSDKKEQKGDSLNSPFMEINTANTALIMTATVETVVEQLDLILPEKMIPTVSRAVTLPESDSHSSQYGRSSLFSDGDSGEKFDDDSEEGADDIWHTSVGNFHFTLENLPTQLQYLHTLFQELVRVESPSVLYSILQSLYLLILHGDILSKNLRDHPGFVIWCQENLIIRNIWELCNAEHSHLCQVCVPILLHCISLASGSDIFRKILHEEFHSDDWRVRFVAVERVTVMARFMDSTPLRNNTSLQSVLTGAFCYLIASMDDKSELVAQRATLYLGTIHDYAMKSLIKCLEVYFDYNIVDRPMVLQSLYQLHNSLSDRKILTWEFFYYRFDTLFIEAQVRLEKSGGTPHYQDLKNYDRTNEVFVKKLHRAQEALAQISDPTLVKTLSASFGTKWPYKRTMSAPASMLSRRDSKLDKDKIYNRQFSAPVLKRKSSRFGLEPYNQQMMVNQNEDSNVCNTLPKIIALEEVDKETMHLLIFLLMQFMSRSDQVIPSEDKNLGKFQNIVLKHLFMLLGYNQTERTFHVPPAILRNSAVFNAFLSNLPQLLDQNYKMGTVIVPTTLLLLQYCPCPPHNIILVNQNNPTYTLWYLETHIRRFWIMSLFDLLYKYNYKKPPLNLQVINLIRIVLNTLNAQHHVCHPIPLTVMSVSALPSYSRDLSQRSIGGETPPQSPGNLTHTSFRAKKSATSMETHWEEESPTNSKRTYSSHSGPDESESMFPAAVQRCKSDSTVPCGSPVVSSFEEAGVRIQEFTRTEFAKKPVWYLGSEDYSQDSHRSTNKVFPSGSSHFPHRSQSSLAKDEQNEASISSKHGTGEVSNTKSTNNGKLTVKGMQNCTSPTFVSSVYQYDEHVKEQQKQTQEMYSSPESPMSKMDLHRDNTRRWTAGSVELLNNKELALPALERLLPIGKSPQRHSDEGILSIADPASEDKPKFRQRKRSTSEFEAHPLNFNRRFSNIDNIDLQNRSRSISPRRLMKQVALESPCDDVFIKSSAEPEDLEAEHNDKVFGNIPSNPHALLEYMHDHGFWSGSFQRGSSIDPVLENACHASSSQKQSIYRVGDECTSERCSECGTIKEEYNDDEIGLCLIVIGTFVHREPALAASMLHEILSTIAKLSTMKMYSWQVESNVNVPGSSSRVAKQFIRVILQQLAPNGVFIQMFRTPIHDCGGIDFFKSVVQALIDFKELCPITPLMLLFEMMNNKKSLPLDRLPIILNNVARYLECILMENLLLAWGPFLTQTEIFFRRVSLIMPTFDSITQFYKNMVWILRIPGVVLFKSILDPFSKVLSYGIENFVIKYRLLLEICFHCNRAFTRERDKLMLTRVVIYEFVQALKCKIVLLEPNFLTLVSFVLQDMGGMLPSSASVDSILQGETIGLGVPLFNTGAAEVMRQNFADVLEFVADFHSLTRIKSNYKCNLAGLNEDTIGGTLKGGLSQYIALELARGTSRDNRVLSRYLPWYSNAPVLQQTIKEFVDCMGHIRLTSWLLVGTLTNNCLSGSSCQSIPQEVSCCLADHVQVVLRGFPDHAKASVVHMSSLFYVFMLCQLWTIYLEHLAASHKPNSEPYVLTMSILFDFWGKVTPAVLRLISHSKLMCDMVNMHFVCVVEALVECRSPSLNKLMPIWRPILDINGTQPSGHLIMRFLNCQNSTPPSCVTTASINVNNSILLKWLQRLQFRMGQIELQSSQATQFYSV